MKWFFGVWVFLSFGIQISHADELDDMLSDLSTVVLGSDFDGTLAGPGWPTMWLLKKIPKLQTQFQAAAIARTPGFKGFNYLPDEVPVSESEFFEIAERTQLAVTEKNNTFTVGSLKPWFLPAIPGVAGREVDMEFIPGAYAVTAESFKNFKERLDGQSQLLIDNEISRRHEKSLRARFGIAFALFKKLTNQPETLKNIFILTARPQSEFEFLALIREWYNEGLIRFAQYQKSKRSEIETVTVFPLGREEGLLYGERIAAQKVTVLNDEMVEHYRLKSMQDGKKYTIIYEENDPTTIAAVSRLFKHLSGIKEYKKHLNFILVHAGTEAQVARSPIPARVTVFRQSVAVAAEPALSDFIIRQSSDGFAGASIRTSKVDSISKGLKCSEMFGR